MRSWSGRLPNVVLVCGGGVFTCPEFDLIWTFLSNGSNEAAKKRQNRQQRNSFNQMRYSCMLVHSVHAVISKCYVKFSLKESQSTTTMARGEFSFRWFLKVHECFFKIFDVNHVAAVLKNWFNSPKCCFGTELTRTKTFAIFLRSTNFYSSNLHRGEETQCCVEGQPRLLKLKMCDIKTKQ